MMPPTKRITARPNKIPPIILLSLSYKLLPTAAKSAIVMRPTKVLKPRRLVGGRMSIGSYCHFAARLKRGPGLVMALFILLMSCGAPQADLSVSTLRSQTGTFPYDAVPSRALEDVNPSSPFYETLLAAEDFQGQVTVWYFSHATCSYCRSQYVLLDQMQQELKNAFVSPQVQILAINGAEFEAGVSAMSDEGDLPLLQDTETIDLWGLWNIAYRDVVVVDAALVPIARINLTTHDLATTTTYDALKTLILDVVAHSD